LSDGADAVSQFAADDGVRPEKVAAIQAALAAGTYFVPTVAVASRLVDMMLCDLLSPIASRGSVHK